MSESRVVVGSLPYWLLMRFAQGLIILVGLSAAVAVRSSSVKWELILILIVWFVYAIYLDSYIYGFADDNGVHFRRYIAMHFVSWNEIVRVSWFGPNVLSLRLKRGPFVRRELNANSGSSRSILTSFKGEPELVRWLLVAKPSAADRIELAPWGSQRVLSQRAKLFIRILIVAIAGATVAWILYNVVGVL